MAKKLTKDEALQRCVAYYRQRIDQADPATTLSQAVDSHLRVVLTKAGYQRVSPKVLERLEASLHEAGLDTFPDLLDPTIDRDTRIYFFDRDHPIPGLRPRRELFSDEEELERFLANNFELISAFRGLHLRGRQVRVGGLRLDLLAEEKRTKRLVGIELKAHEPDQRLATQVGQYLTALEALGEKEGKPAGKLLVITGQPDTEIQRSINEIAAARGADVSWLLYRTTIELTEAPSV